MRIEEVAKIKKNKSSELIAYIDDLISMTEKDETYHKEVSHLYSLKKIFSWARGFFPDIFNQEAKLINGEIPFDKAEINQIIDFLEKLIKHFRLQAVKYPTERVGANNFINAKIDKTMAEFFKSHQDLHLTPEKLKKLNALFTEEFPTFLEPPEINYAMIWAECYGIANLVDCLKRMQKFAVSNKRQPAPSHSPHTFASQPPVAAAPLPDTDSKKKSSNLVLGS